MWDILRTSLDPLNQHLKFIFLDILWRSIWVVCSALGFLFLWFGVVGQLGSIQWQGPDMGPANPIMLLAALRQFWNAHGATILTELGVVVLAVFFLWLVLEALFRGGFRGFWIYLGTGIGRIVLLGGGAAVFGILGRVDESRGTFVVGGVLILSLWFLLSILETAIRRDALDLIAVDLPEVVKVFATLMLGEVFIGFVLWGSVLAALLRSSGPSLMAILLAIGVFVVPFWLVLHSYLIAVRFSAIDIMRRNLE